MQAVNKNGCDVASLPSVHVLYDGYSHFKDGKQLANCSCVLIKGELNVIIDTMTAWDKENIIKGLSSHNIDPNDINYVIGSHGHSDHVGNLNLFSKAKHIVGYTVSQGNVFFEHHFEKGDPYIINDHIKVVATPGHTKEHVSVLVQCRQYGSLAVAGDLFEKEKDIDDPKVWQEAGSEDQSLQLYHRSIIADAVDVIVPGHGPMFVVTEHHRVKLREQLKLSTTAVAAGTAPVAGTTAAAAGTAATTTAITTGNL